MAEYSYRGFNITYQVDSKDHRLYKANGKAIKSEEKTTPNNARKFHTEHPTENGAKKAIKKLIEDYVDFEWKEYYEMH
ncbi:MAG: hypothetical protein WC785_03220 [Tatlockia sp.]|jgi:hypothetical protein